MCIMDLQQIKHNYDIGVTIMFIGIIVLTIGLYVALKNPYPMMI